MLALTVHVVVTGMLLYKGTEEIRFRGMMEEEARVKGMVESGGKVRIDEGDLLLRMSTPKFLKVSLV